MFPAVSAVFHNATITAGYFDEVVFAAEKGHLILKISRSLSRRVKLRRYCSAEKEYLKTTGLNEVSKVRITSKPALVTETT